MRWEPCPLIDGAYSDDAKPWSSQDTVNWLPTPAEQAGTRSPWMLQTPPGLVEFCDLGTGRPIRGAHDVEGLLLVVSGTTLFRVNPDGTSTSLGAIPGVERVSMDHTPRGTGFHVGIANGQSGYVYDTVTNTLTQITDPGFPGASIFQFIDGYLAFLEPFGKFWGHSELNDALSYNTLDRYTAESAPDGIVSLIVSHREVFTPGTRSGEFFRNTGSATGTFQRADGYEMERGAASTFAIARLDNTVYWLGEDGIVYRLEGHQPVRVSTGPIEQAIARCNLTNAFAFTWEDKGHKVFYLTFPDGFTWGYDAWTNKWHRRQSYGLDRWRLATMTRWNRQWIAGDYTNGKLYTVSWDEDAVHENGEPMVSERTFPVAHDYCNDLIINGLRLLFDTGRGGPSRPIIAGDVPGGAVGTAISGTYVVSGGIEPYGPITVLSGTFPPGLTLNANGTYTGTLTTPGSYSWTVGGEDAFGAPFSTPDTATVTAASLVTWNPAEKAAEITLSGGNLIATGPGTNINTLVFATASHSTGKHYFEIVLTAAGTNGSAPHVGVMLAQVDKYGFVGGDTNGWGLRRTGNIDHFPTHNNAAYATASAQGDVIMVAVDMDAGKLWFGRNGSWLVGGDPAAGTNPTFTGVAGAVFPVATLSHPVGDPVSVVTARFASGSWGYSAPSGFSQW